MKNFQIHILNRFNQLKFEKKFKDKQFAAKCNREIISKGVEDLGMTLDEVMEICIKGMAAHADEF